MHFVFPCIMHQTCYKNTLLVIQLCTITFSYYGAPLGLYMYDGREFTFVSEGHSEKKTKKRNQILDPLPFLL